MAKNSKQEDQLRVLMRYFLEKFGHELLLDMRNPESFEERKVLHYFNRLSDVAMIVERLHDYPIYFKKFYPSTEQISDAEALEYHLHSYLQDFYSLEERINRIVNELKGDLEEYGVENKEEVKKALDHIREQVSETLSQPHELRRKHTHENSLSDLEISKAKMIGHHGDEIGLEEEFVEEYYDEMIDKTKQKYISRAEENREKISGIENFFAARFGYFFVYLNEDDPEQFDMDAGTDL